MRLFLIEPLWLCQPYYYHLCKSSFSESCLSWLKILRFLINHAHTQTGGTVNPICSFSVWLDTVLALPLNASRTNVLTCWGCVCVHITFRYTHTHMHRDPRESVQRLALDSSAFMWSPQVVAALPWTPWGRAPLWTRACRQPPWRLLLPQYPWVRGARPDPVPLLPAARSLVRLWTSVEVRHRESHTSNKPTPAWTLIMYCH